MENEPQSKCKVTRREFLGRAATLAAGTAGAAKLGTTALSYGRIVGANDRIALGHIGIGNRGTELDWVASRLKDQNNAEMIAVCELWTVNCEKAVAKNTKYYGRAPRACKYAEELLALKDVDAVLISTPEHSHSPLLRAAAEAGKDAYCEKPMSHTLEDGFAMIDAVQKNKRISQIGSQRVSSILYAKAKEIWDSGRLGEVDTIEAVWDRNTDSGAWIYPIPPDANEKTVDWNTWLGDAPKRPFDGRRFVSWRCYKDYGAGLPGDLFVHLISGIHYITGTNAPATRAFSTGGIYHYKDGREFGDLQWTMYDYPKFQVVLRCNQNNKYEDQLFAFYGKKGTLFIRGEGAPAALGAGASLAFRPEPAFHTREDYSIGSWPEKQREEYIAEWNREHPRPAIGEDKVESAAEVYAAPAGYSDLVDHLANFFQAVRTRKPVVENEIFGNNAAVTGCHMSNYSYFNKTVAVWDASSKSIKSPS
jgi:predicted dehydrogenase